MLFVHNVQTIMSSYYLGCNALSLLDLTLWHHYVVKSDWPQGGDIIMPVWPSWLGLLQKEVHVYLVMLIYMTLNAILCTLISCFLLLSGLLGASLLESKPHWTQWEFHLSKHAWIGLHDCNPTFADPGISPIEFSETYFTINMHSRKVRYLHFCRKC